jgi:hypothetical protein
MIGCGYLTVMDSVSAYCFVEVLSAYSGLYLGLLLADFRRPASADFRLPRPTRVMEHLLLRLLAHRAGVEKDDVRMLLPHLPALAFQANGSRR